MKIRLIKPFLGAVLSLILLSCGSNSTIGQSKLSPTDFNNKIKTTANPQILDVRTPDEYNSGHIENAINLNIYDDDFNQKLDLLNKADTIYVYCKAGGRSSDAAGRLTAKGFKNVYDLEGGMMKWEQAKLPIAGVKTKTSNDQYSLAEYDSIVKSQPLIVVDFYAPWCGPCKQMSPYLEKLKATYPENKLKIFKVDVDQNKAISDHFKISSIPFIKFYNNGTEYTSKLGFISESEMLDILKPYLK